MKLVPVGAAAVLWAAGTPALAQQGGILVPHALVVDYRGNQVIEVNELAAMAPTYRNLGPFNSFPAVTREQMSVFIGATFGLALYGP